MATLNTSKGDLPRNIGFETSGETGRGFSDLKKTNKHDLEVQLTNPDITEEQATSIRIQLKKIEQGEAGVIPQGELGRDSLLTQTEIIADSKNLKPQEILSGMVNMDGKINPYILTNQIEQLRKKHNPNNN